MHHKAEQGQGGEGGAGLEARTTLRRGSESTLWGGLHPEVRERTWTRLRPALEHSKATTTDVESGWGFSDKTKAVVLGTQRGGGSPEMPSK